MDQEQKPFWQSKGVVGGVLAAAAGVVGLFGVDFSELTQPEVTDLVISAGAAVGGVVALVGRLVAKAKLVL